MHVLITGGSRGIGLGLATRFLDDGHTVLVTGRDAGQLDRVAAGRPGLRTFHHDVGRPADRERLAAHVHATMPRLDVLINNAGLQRRVPLAADTAPWASRQAEIDVLLAGPVHLNHLLVPVMLRHGGPSLVVNVTSGGAFVPQPFAPLYSACKAALHSHTVTLRHALAHTPCRVVELVPPAVATGLAGRGTHGVPVDEFCDAVYPALFETGRTEVGHGPTAGADLRDLVRAGDALFDRFAERFPVATY